MLLSPAATHSCVQNLPGIAWLFVFLLFLFTPLSWVEQHDMSNMPDMSGTNPNDMHAPAVPEDPQTVARAGPAEATAYPHWPSRQAGSFASRTSLPALHTSARDQRRKNFSWQPVTSVGMESGMGQKRPLCLGSMAEIEECSITGRVLIKQALVGRL